VGVAHGAVERTTALERGVPEAALIEARVDDLARAHTAADRRVGRHHKVLIDDRALVVGKRASAAARSGVVGAVGRAVSVGECALAATSLIDARPVGVAIVFCRKEASVISESRRRVVT
jgi:hypothetical protein